MGGKNENNNDRHAYSSIEKYLITKVPIVKDNATVKRVLLMLEKISNKYDAVDCIYVIDKKGNLAGMFYIQELFNNPKDTPVKKLIQRDIVKVPLGTEIEKVAHIALKHDLGQVPVVASEKLIGVISSNEILSVINRSLKKDILHFAGIHKSHLGFDNSLEIPLLKSVKNRMYWLIIGVLGAMFMAFYIGLFEETLAKYLIIASFAPAIVYISGALGTQIQTVFVRDLAILGRELKLKKYFFRQMGISFLIASAIGIIMFSSVSLFWSAPHMAFVISLATFVALIFTGFTAFLITLLIKRLKFDPALGSGPIATIISDVTSVVIYFIVVASLV